MRNENGGIEEQDAEARNENGDGHENGDVDERRMNTRTATSMNGDEQGTRAAAWINQGCKGGGIRPYAAFWTFC